MKFNCGPSKETKLLRKAEKYINDYGKWHKVFLIIPHRFSDNDCRWLEWAWGRADPAMIYILKEEVAKNIPYSAAMAMEYMSFEYLPKEANPLEDGDGP